MKTLFKILSILLVILVTGCKKPDPGDQEILNSIELASSSSGNNYILLPDQTVMTWNGAGAPAAIPGAIDVTSISSNLTDVYMSFKDGSVAKWDGNALTNVAGFSNVVALSTAEYSCSVLNNTYTGASICALKKDSTADCQKNGGAISTVQYSGSNLKNISSIASTPYLNSNRYFVLKNGSVKYAANQGVAAQNVNDLSNVAKMTASYEYACALLNDGSVKCGLPGSFAVEAGISAAIDIAANENDGCIYPGQSICVVLADGSVKCKGDHYGALTTIVGLSDITKIESHSDGDFIALKSDYTIWTWAPGDTVAVQKKGF